MPFIESLPTELRLKGLAPDEVFKQYSLSEIEAYLLKRKKDSH